MAITIVKGSAAKVKVRVADRETRKPWNFFGFVGATAQFFGATAGEPVNIIGSNPETNLLEFDLQPSDTALLAAGDSIDFQYQWQQNSDLNIEQVQGQLVVVEQLNF
jgi:hypothetical protein